jgi:hypothetical protein
MTPRTRARRSRALSLNAPFRTVIPERLSRHVKEYS